MKFILASLFVFSFQAFAGICEISIERESCPGKETESYVKCGGQKSCSSKKKADNFDACVKLAESECSNSRTDITKSKIIKAKYDGKTSENLCKSDRADFNKCK